MDLDEIKAFSESLGYENTAPTLAAARATLISSAVEFQNIQRN